MPRRSGGGGGMRSSSPSRAPPPPARAVAPRPVAAPAPVAAPQGRQPGLFGQMAATAGGVAIGSAVGHTIGAALTGGGRRGDDQPAVAQEATGVSGQPLYQTANERYTPERCNLYQKEFMKCLDQSSGDSTQCQGFWDALKECQRFQSPNASF